MKLFAFLLALVTVLIAPVPGNAQSKTKTHPKHKHAVRKKATTAASATTKVWLTDKTLVYHYPGTRWYGNTKHGQFVTEAEAKKMGGRAAANGQ